MMTTLCEMIMECRAIKGMDRLILFGWAHQVEEGNETLYCSKATVAEFLGVSEDTVLRRTQDLVRDGWLLDTGEQKQWSCGWTPVRTVNVPVIVGLIEAQCRKLRPTAECTPPQNAAQGSNRFTGSRFLPPSSTTYTTRADATGVPPVGVSAPPKGEEKVQTENLKTENLKTLAPTPTPTPTPKPKACPKCGEPWSRDANHVCGVMPIIKGNYAAEACPRVEAPVVKKREPFNFDEDEEPEPEATPHGQPPVARVPLTPAEVCKRYTGDEIWDERGRTRDTPAGRAWAASRGEEIIRPTGINP
jgi:hypothetical protein